MEKCFNDALEDYKSNYIIEEMISRVLCRKTLKYKV